MKPTTAVFKTILFFLVACMGMNFCAAAGKAGPNKNGWPAYHKSNAPAGEGPGNGVKANSPPATPPDERYVLPVVFHIINEDPYAVTDGMIQAALADLNDAFSKSGKYAGSKGADTKISFCLAREDPDGGSTTGITRTPYYFGNDLAPDIEDAKLKGLIQWDPLHYINIWYVLSMHKEISATFSCGTWSRLYEGGYATLPPNAGVLDGIVVTGFGPLLAHEMGHYLGLLHTFDGGCSNYRCDTDGDGVCDTPPEYLPYSNAPACGTPVNSCSSDTLSGFTKDMPDPKSNFMDYSNAACQNEFTEGQAQRMHKIIAGQRSTLLVSKCSKPCAENSVAAFTRNIDYPVPGDVITFTNNASGAVNFQWLVDDVPVSTGKNYSYTVTAAGRYKITLKAYNGNAACFAAYSDYVTVTCGVRARFYTNKQYIASRTPVYPDSLVFTNTSENATAYQWLMSSSTLPEQVIATTKDLTYTFQTPGTYAVRLIATNGTCADTTLPFTVPVDEPTQDGAVYLYSVNCYQQTKVQLQLYFCNYGYADIPKGTPVSFYDADPRTGNAHKLSPSFYLPDPIVGHCCGWVYTHVVDVKAQGLNQLYAVFNDSGTAVPIRLPNTKLAETNYDNNINRSSGFAFKATVSPPAATLEPGDTLELKASGSPNSIAAYKWYPAYNLSCSNCATTRLIADSSSIKSVVVTSVYGCYNTAQANINVPPADDYTITITDVQCARGDSLQVAFTLNNSFKRGIIPKGLTVAFYNGNPANAGAQLLPGLFSVPATVRAQQAAFNTLIQGMKGANIYAVVNDSGRQVPVQLPAGKLLEKDYTNNIAVAAYTAWSVSVVPATATLEPGDTIPLHAAVSPPVPATYAWLPASKLSCPACDTTYLVADSNRTIQVIASNAFGCKDTAWADILVPPADDYTVVINDVQCASDNRLRVRFTVQNAFKRGVIPRGLPIAFYTGNPSAGNAALLSPVFEVPRMVAARVAEYTTYIQGITSGSIYAVANDRGTTLPLQLPNTPFLEKDYTNNGMDTLYQPEQLKLLPADTTVVRTSTFAYALAAPLYNPSSATWQQGSGYKLSCERCTAPTITVWDSSAVTMKALNPYGCWLEGRATVHILPPDFTLQLLQTACFTNHTTLVRFRICAGNKYDSVAGRLPVAFYDSDPSLPGAHLLSPVFYTPGAVAGSCLTYTHTVRTPATGRLYARVNDEGSAGPQTYRYNETDGTNNVSDTLAPAFTVSILPADTSVALHGTMALTVVANSDTLRSVVWQPARYLSCATCPSPVLTPPYTLPVSVLAYNQHGCTDTAYAIVKTFTGGLVNIPGAFTPNGDGRNDVFYILAGKAVSRIKDFAVYDRWGKRVFYTGNAIPNTPVHGWDGTAAGMALPAGTYIYQVSVVLDDGTHKLYNGTVVLIR